jgi:dTDP-glucose 4,6-dehydratase
MISTSDEKFILITGGAGFIGSHLVRRFVRRYPGYHIVNLDALTYAGNLENLADVESAPNYAFEKGDITDRERVFALFADYHFDGVIHLAAESHVDRSIVDAGDFLKTNVQGTVNLLDACRDSWDGHFAGKVFLHVSTDEVFGSLESGSFNEGSPYHPNSPYAASKAASDHFVRAYSQTYGLPAIISNCSNNYGPNQFPEKLIPLLINNLIHRKPLPLYGKGANVRDWLHVEDHTTALDQMFHHGAPGETYCVGGGNEWKNLDLARALCSIVDRKMDREPGTSGALITFVKDRPGHDLRYAIDTSKIERELGWKPVTSIEAGLEKTVDWYLGHRDWLHRVTSGAYRDYYEKMYPEKRQE